MNNPMLFALIGICLALICFASMTDTLSKKRRWLLIALIISSVILLISVPITDKHNGDISLFGIYATRISKFLNYGSYLLITYLFTGYLKDLLGNEGKLKTMPKALKVSNLFLLIGLIVLGLSQSVGFYYYFDGNNIYHRGAGNAVSYLFPTAAILILIYVIIKYRRNLQKRLFVPLLLFTAVPPVFSTVHFINPEFNLTGAAIVGTAILLYCFSILDANDLSRIAHKKEGELVRQTAYALSEAIDAKDSYTNGHSRRVAEYSVEIAKRAGKSEDELDKIYLIALLHDVGKIGIAGSIINKEGKLTDEEYAAIKTHPVIGREILSKITIMPDLSIGASFHHERYDGKGYPYGLKGDEIPEIARIIAVADTYDAMASKRSYRDTLPKEKIREELLKGMGTQFDPIFAKIMVDIIDEH